MFPVPRRFGRVEWYEITPAPTAEEHQVLLAALELALATEAKEIPASGWSSPQYRDGSSLRPGTRVWSAGEESHAPRRPGYPYPMRRRPR
jgi:hypothetical protein